MRKKNGETATQPKPPLLYQTSRAVVVAVDESGVPGRTDGRVQNYIDSGTCNQSIRKTTSASHLWALGKAWMDLRSKSSITHDPK